MEVIKIMENSVLKVLILEDSFEDMELISVQLSDAGYQIDVTHAENEESFRKAIQKKQYDCILSDFKLPDFDAFSALKICREFAPNTPFICVSGSIGEETSIELLKQGAVDYVLKDRPIRLPFAVQRALDEAKEKAAHFKAEKDLIESEKRFRQVAETAQEWIWEVDVDGMLTYSSPVIENLLGYTPDEVVGKKHFYDFFSDEKFVESKKSALEIISKKKTFRNFENTNIHKNGTRVILSTSGGPVFDHKGNITGYRGVCEDITEFRRAQIQLEKNLEEKNLLLRELYHRTKNNMQVILSMLKIQMRTINDDRITDVFNDISNKIKAMALAHQKLYEAEDLSNICLSGYIQDLLRHLTYSFSPITKRIELHQALEDIIVTIDKAVPLGLILTELISNAFKHAFPDERDGVISIELYASPPNKMILEISDNGIGIKDHRSIHEIKGMGLENVFNLVEHQLQGHLECVVDQGIRWRIILDYDVQEISRV
jgi:PAS domain S-box-containing protein